MEARFEFRCFGRELSGFRDQMAGKANYTGVRESEEFYFVPPDPGEVNIKYRNGQIDVKKLLKTEHGLEQWSPILKMKLPAPGIALKDALSPLAGFDLQLPEDDLCDLEQIAAEFTKKPSGWKFSRVKKTRYGYELEQCLLEYARLDVDGEMLETVAVEHENTSLIRSVMEILGLNGQLNMNYVRALNNILWK